MEIKKTEDGKEIVWGRYSYGEVINDGAVSFVGSFCSVARGVRACSYFGHRQDWVTTYPFKQVWNIPDAPDPIVPINERVIIGNDVWIGAYSVLLGGCMINDGAIIGSFSVVHGEIPPYSVAVGNPCKVIRKRFSDETISKLLEIQWWNWSEEKIKKYIPLLSSDRMDEFINGI